MTILAWLTFDTRVGIVVGHPSLSTATRASALQPWACALQLILAGLAQHCVADTPANYRKKNLSAINLFNKKKVEGKR